jgi:hypothetical protein
MNRVLVASFVLGLSAATLGAQQDPQYQGTSTPPPDDTIVMTTQPKAKPPAGQPMQDPATIDIQIDQPRPGQPQAQPQTYQPQTYQPQPGQSQPGQSQPGQPQPTSVDPAYNYPAGTDNDMVQGAPAPMPPPAQPALALRSYAPQPDPDGDMVHPTFRADELGEGTTIRVKLLDRLSTADSEKGEAFRSQVASDVLQGGQVLIPAGAEIDGQVVQVSSGDHLGGHGTMHLRPDVVILAGGSRYRLRAELSGAPGSKARVGGEGAIRPGSRVARGSIEYGGAVGAGVVTGAVLGGPVGALTGGVIGAGLVTTHLLVSHPQATLEPGTTLLFTLTEPLRMTATSYTGN